ncbi:MAG TPA: hypothetical protein H9717_16295 [Candidatus Eisenbergiella merdipullorum]|uniref:Six-hairpin glycosidase n=1 Tax=Candidatus Eisenbergiella merdipullorum TaxID=2838553 RepID=A0A9D2L0H1_9FIRM|nr:hypothetical protein [Candidatus Eisenbergiella merdipullorum]
MKKITYRKATGENRTFLAQWDEQGRLISLQNSQDTYGMNWVKGEQIWGTVFCAPDLTVEVEHRFTERGTLAESYTFRNDTAFDIYTVGTQLGICVQFPDYYTDAAVCMTQCCNTHLWCGGGSSYICALRMGGGRINLGLVLTKGSLKGYSVQRNLEKQSNDRGAFLLHPEDLHVRPGESVQMEWELFWFTDREDFRRKALSYSGFIWIEAEHFLLFDGEAVQFRAFVGERDGNGDGENGNGLNEMNDEICQQRPVIYRNGEKIGFSWKNGVADIADRPVKCGEYRYEIEWMGKRSHALFLVQPESRRLAERRCQFIMEKQQCRDEKSCLNGAYLIYDREERSQYYSHAFSDHNGGRERVGMGVLLAEYLQEHPDRKLEESLDEYVRFVRRELLDEENGIVYNDVQRNDELKRLYNYPWVCVLFLEMFRLKKDRWFLQAAYRVMEAYYREGGSRFYAIAIPMRESVEIFRENGMEEEAARLLLHYREHGDRIAKLGKNYPAHEVKYEQSIVAPAAIYLCELYHLTGEEKYARAAREQLAVLELFQGLQPDYHMYEVAIRHWDGYWFGKRACYGDTFPHYWSALTGIAFRTAEGIPGCEVYAGRAEEALRGTLSMFFADGSASCACVYPIAVNGRPGGYYDPWANDQDWGLYFYLKYIQREKGLEQK